MARGINKVLLIGHLGQDPELRYTPSGTAVCKFSLATTISRKKGDEWEEITDWHRIVTFGKMAETAGQYLNKGKQIYIEGRLSYGSYEDKDGVKRYTTDIIANDMQFLGGRGEGGSGGGGRPANEDSGYSGASKRSSRPELEDNYSHGGEDEDDLPF